MLKRHKKTLDISVVELEKYNKDFKEAHILINDATNRLQDIEDSLNKFGVQKDDINSEIDKRLQELQDLEKNLNEFKSYELEMTNRMEKLNTLLHSLEKIATRLTNELSGYKLRDVDEIIKLLENDSQHKSVSSEGNDMETNEYDSSTVTKSTTGSDGTNDNEVNSTGNDLNLDQMDVDHEDKEISKGIPSLSEETLQTLDCYLQQQKIKDL